MKQAFFLIIILAILFPSAPSAAVENQVKAAFIRGGNLWTLIGDQEKQVTNQGKVFSKPQWSTDGNLLVYQVEAPSEIYKGETQSELWTYNIKTEEKKKIFYDGSSPKWAPHRTLQLIKTKEYWTSQTFSGSIISQPESTILRGFRTVQVSFFFIRHSSPRWVVKRFFVYKKSGR